MYPKNLTAAVPGTLLLTFDILYQYRLICFVGVFFVSGDRHHSFIRHYYLLARWW